MVPLVAVLALVLPASPAGAARLAVPAHPVALGVVTDGMYDDMGAALDSFASETGAMPAIVNYFRDWYPGWSDALIDPKLTTPIDERHGIPMITWDPYIAEGGAQPTLQTISSGAYDDYLIRAADEVAAYGQPLFIRFAHEMNGNWYAWGNVPGNTPAQFIAAWRHVVALFRQHGATNALWVWSPNVVTGYSGIAPISPYYPGDAWVDWVALDGYNWGNPNGGTWQSFSQVFSSDYNVLQRLTTKPEMIAETASAEQGGSKATWITNTFLGELPLLFPHIRAVIWFNEDKTRDWRVNSSASSLAAFQSVVSAGAFDESAQQLLAGVTVPSGEQCSVPPDQQCPSPPVTTPVSVPTGAPVSASAPVSTAGPVSAPAEPPPITTTPRAHPRQHARHKGRCRRRRGARCQRRGSRRRGRARARADVSPVDLKARKPRG